MIQSIIKVDFKGFTLAEVLITLGIIGVVAALTVPVLINFFQDKADEVAFKKMYSNLSNAIKEVTQENGGLAYKCFVDSSFTVYKTECSTFWDSVFEKLKPIKSCSGGFAGGCQPQYAVLDDVVAAGGSRFSASCSGSKEYANSKGTYTLADGSVIGSYYTTIEAIPLFIIDTNGFKKPNKWGYDVFVLTLDVKANNPNNIYVSDRYCWIYEKGGKRIDNILIGN